LAQTPAKDPHIRAPVPDTYTYSSLSPFSCTARNNEIRYTKCSACSENNEPPSVIYIQKRMKISKLFTIDNIHSVILILC
jgi:hypothetical protein